MHSITMGSGHWSSAHIEKFSLVNGLKLNLSVNAEHLMLSPCRASELVAYLFCFGRSNWKDLPVEGDLTLKNGDQQQLHNREPPWFWPLWESLQGQEGRQDLCHQEGGQH